MNDNNIIKDNFLKLYEIIKQLRGPGGCEWDKKQTAYTLRSSLLEETFECINAIQNKNDENLKEELGDMFLVILMITRIKEQENAFLLGEILNDITEKIIRRHPHVFGNEKDKSVKGILKKWEEIKDKVEGKYNNKKYMDNVPFSLHSLERAKLIQKYAGKVGFDWKEPMPVIEKLNEEINELIHEIKPQGKIKGNKKNIEMEIGDILFSVINLSRILKIDPSLALNSTNNKFIRRFNRLEEKLKSDNMNLKDTDLEVMDNIWNKIKAEEK
jgi:tetrapyrrole methylase family protein/MazG family protein